MIIKPEDLDKRSAYKLLTSIIVPRPIAWVTTINEDGSANAAPFSFFMGVSSHPPRLAISVGTRRGERKDTALNIERTDEFVVNVVTKETAEAMNQTSGEYEYGVDELEKVGLTPAESSTVQPAGIAESPVRMECRFEKGVGFDDTGTEVIFGRVLAIYIDDALYSDGAVDPELAEFVGRMGAPNYVNVKDVFPIEKPKID